jgi:hypothetical protein
MQPAATENSLCRLFLFWCQNNDLNGENIQASNQFSKSSFAFSNTLVVQELTIKINII